MMEGIPECIFFKAVDSNPPAGIAQDLTPESADSSRVGNRPKLVEETHDALKGTC